MRLQPAGVEDTLAVVQQHSPSARLLNRTADRLSFSIPQEVSPCLGPFKASELRTSPYQWTQRPLISFETEYRAPVVGFALAAIGHV